MELFWVSLGIILAIWIERKLYDPQRISCFDYTLELSHNRVMEGDSLSLKEAITNTGLLPFSYIQTRIEAPAGLDMIDESVQISIHSGAQSVTQKTSLLWFQKATRRHELQTVKRGVYPIKLASLRYSDALLFDRHSLDVKGHDTLVVYPRIYDIQEIIPVPENLFGDYFVQRWILEDPFFSSGVRNYQPSDQLRFVDWKSTAKYQEMKSRTHDYTNSNQLHLVLNLQSKGSDEEDAYPQIIEDIIRIGASIVRSASEEGFSIGFYANSACIGYAGQTVSMPPNLYEGRESLFEFLARLNNFHTQKFNVFLERQEETLNHQADIIIVTGYIDDSIYHSLRYLNDTALSLKVITLGEIDQKYNEGLSLYPSVIPSAIKGGAARE